LGDIYTELLYPAMSSHRMLTSEQRAAVGISDALIRLSAGIEDAGDLLADLDQALRKVP
jgi:cystathionine beta-lyase/cystathionine gamma-synthase